MTWQIIEGDCVEVMRGMENDSIDAICTDPPYGLGFMGKKWDDLPPGIEWAKECLRVLKPGAFLLAFGGTRTSHRLACAIEDADFEIRDTICWLYGQGFPKSRDISKDIDKAAGVEREVVGKRKEAGMSRTNKILNERHDYRPESYEQDDEFISITIPATPEAKQWQGFGTAIKPAHEPIVVARKPLSEKTVAANVLKHGTGGLNIDGTRIGTEENLSGGAYAQDGKGRHDGYENWRYKREGGAGEYQQPSGRWPANVVLNEEAAESLDQQTSGGASRFFYTAKASKTERNAGLTDFPEQATGVSDDRPSGDFNERLHAGERTRVTANNTHPTVKPISLMRWLVRLVTPPDGTILDPFAGSGSTGCAAVLEGFSFIGIEKEESYIPIAKARIAHWDPNPFAGVPNPFL